MDTVGTAVAAVLAVFTLTVLLFARRGIRERWQTFRTPSVTARPSQQSSQTTVTGSQPRPLAPPRSVHAVADDPARAVRFLMVRHGERLDHVHKGWSGTAEIPRGDSPLSPQGIVQSLETALHLRTLRLKQLQPNRETEVKASIHSFFVASSPLLRCLQTAVILWVVGLDCDPRGFSVSEALSDWYSPKLYRDRPQLASRAALGEIPIPHKDMLNDGTSSRTGASRLLLPDAVFDAVDSSLCVLQQHQKLLRQFHVKAKHCDRWAACAAALRREKRSGVSFAECPIPFPEGTLELRRRCAGIVSSPPLLKVHPDGTASSADALTQPVVVYVTHADVIRATLEETFPRVKHKFEGFSVPYCSITSFSATVGCESSPCAETNVNVGDTGHLRHSAVLVAYY